MRIKLDADALLCQALIGLLLASYVVLVFVFVIVPFNPPPFSPLSHDTSPLWWQNLLALVVLALTFRPVYRWVRGSVRALVYSHHDDPFPALAQLNQRLQTTPTPQAVLPSVAESIAHMLKLPYVRIEARPQPSGEAGGQSALTDQAADYLAAQLSGEYGSPPPGAAIVRVPLTYHEAPIGELLAAARSKDDRLSDSELRLLHDLARHVGVALHAARLTDDLQRARERLVIAREEERRRIRNDLHDGLAPTLSSLQLQLGLLRSLVRQDPDKAQAAIEEMRHDLQEATAEIRRLVYDLRPPLLDELGLAGALQNIKFPDPDTCFEVITPPDLPELPAALEVAVYRIASEAVHNVIKHAQASQCIVSISVHDGLLELRVSDDGQSFDSATSGAASTGVGLKSMRERAAELGGSFTVQPCDGGGTCVVAQFPVKTV